MPVGPCLSLQLNVILLHSSPLSHLSVLPLPLSPPISDSCSKLCDYYATKINDIQENLSCRKGHIHTFSVPPIYIKGERILLIKQIALMTNEQTLNM